MKIVAYRIFGLDGPEELDGTVHRRREEKDADDPDKSRRCGHFPAVELAQHRSDRVFS